LKTFIGTKNVVKYKGSNEIVMQCIGKPNTTLEMPSVFYIGDQKEKEKLN